ncbi:MAG: glycosyltransferase 87 family protein [Isosphaeraceae bacterium]|nr:glycosyltransferase 87 family protein [Isosphaeraceae bacterium]
MWLKRFVLCAVPVLALLGYTIFRGAERHNDFKYPYNVARHLWKTGQLKIASQPRYPVTFHVLLAPIASLPIGQAAAVWAVLSFAAVAALPRVFARLSGIAPRRQLLAWLVVLPCLIDALVLGQSDPINLLLVAAGLLAVKAGRGGAGAGLIGTAGMIKFLPVIFWATAIGRCPNRHVWAGILLALCGGFGMVAAAVGREAAVAGIVEQYELIRDYEKPWHLVARGSDLRPNNESLPIVLARTFGDLGPSGGRPSVSLARWPLSVIWGLWGGLVLVLATIWVASLSSAAALPPERGWLGMFGLTAVVMLALTPICWHHYFLWTFPAVLFLVQHRRLIAVVGALSWLGAASQLTRGLGCHMVLALVLFAVVAYDLRRSAARTGPRAERRQIGPTVALPAAP